MIINPSKKYDKLFIDAFNLLQSQGKLDPINDAAIIAAGKFTSLEEYFTHIGDLAELHENCVRGTLEEVNKTTWNARFAQYAKYLMIPLDEEYFKINANTRVISIPTIFASNGVSIAGDQRAETLLFEVDRYFDFIDLLRTNIYVQWTDAKNNTGATLVSLIDYDDQKIRFGWVLSDKVTKDTGNLTFSIRFFMRDNETDTIHYSLNTLPVSVRIRQALRLTIENTYTDEAPYLFTQAIVNGASSNSGTFPIHPIIFEQLPAPADENTEMINVYLDIDNTCTFKVGAYTSDNGKLSYNWKLLPDGQSEIIDLNKNYADYGINISIQYEKTKDTTVNALKSYYTTTDGVAYELFDGDTFVEGTNYYEAIAYCVITDTDKTVTGRYNVNVINTIGANTSTSNSIYWVINKPQSITYTENLNASGNIILENDEGKNLQIRVVPDDSHATLSYQWYYSSEQNGEMSLIAEATNNSYTAQEAGWYKVVTTSTLNRATLESDSEVAKVTYMPVAPTINYEESDQIVNIGFTSDVTEYTASVNIVPLTGDLQTESITYEWLHQVKEGDVTYEPVKVGTFGVTAINNNNITLTWNGDQEVFICKVTNYLNGESASSYSDRYVTNYLVDIE